VSPAVKYTLGRFGLFVVVFALLLPVPLNFFVRAMIALFASAAFSYFLLAKWRIQMAEQLSEAASRRQAEKKRLRAALAGDEAAAAEGDRAALPKDRAATLSDDHTDQAAAVPGEPAANASEGRATAVPDNGTAAPGAIKRINNHSAERGNAAE
jgi:hypothetical protein